MTIWVTNSLVQNNIFSPYQAVDNDLLLQMVGSLNGLYSHPVRLNVRGTKENEWEDDFAQIPRLNLVEKTAMVIFNLHWNPDQYCYVHIDLGPFREAVVCFGETPTQTANPLDECFDV